MTGIVIPSDVTGLLFNKGGVLLVFKALFLLNEDLGTQGDKIYPLGVYQGTDHPLNPLEQEALDG